MARRSHSYCGFRALLPDVEQGGFADDPTYRRGLTWCGDKKLFTERERAESLRLVTCPKCAAAIGAHKLAQMGGRVVLERMAEPLSYDRSSYRLLIDGTHRGWIGTESGWGKGWSLYALPGEYDSWRGFQNVSGERPQRYHATGWAARDESHLFWPVHYAARDAMACAAIAALEAGKLPTEEEREAAKLERARRKAEQEAEAAERAKERQAERERQEAIRDERVETWRAGLESLEARADLTNLERAGLEALKLLFPI